MKKFLVIYNAPAQATASNANPTPEQQAEAMAPWLAWKAQHDNNIVDFGAPLAGGQKVAAQSEWAASGNEVSGYSIVQGTDAESVKEMFKGHPHLAWAPGTYIDVHECLPM